MATRSITARRPCQARPLQRRRRPARTRSRYRRIVSIRRHLTRPDLRHGSSAVELCVVGGRAGLPFAASALRWRRDGRPAARDGGTPEGEVMSLRLAAEAVPGRAINSRAGADCTRCRCERRRRRAERAEPTRLRAHTARRVSASLASDAPLGSRRCSAPHVTGDASSRAKSRDDDERRRKSPANTRDWPLFLRHAAASGRYPVPECGSPIG